METLDTLRKERDEARGLLRDIAIFDLVDAYATSNPIAMIVASNNVRALRWLDQDLLTALLTVGTFLAWCATFVKKTDEGEVLFEAAA